MSTEPKQIILITELDNEQGQFQLELKTRKNSVVGHSVFPQAKQGNSDESKFWTPALAGLEVGV